jgi:hypothetical protein
VSAYFAIGGRGDDIVIYNGGATTAHKKVKIDYIALQCMSLISKKVTSKLTIMRKDGRCSLRSRSAEVYKAVIAPLR